MSRTGILAAPPAAGGRLRRELKTVRAMIRLHCRRRHGTRQGLCPDCDALWAYAQGRIDCCVFGAAKPVCNQCPVHCYKPAMRERIRQVMRFSGPRMLGRHPLLALLHLRDSRRPLPPLPARVPVERPSPAAGRSPEERERKDAKTQRGC